MRAAHQSHPPAADAGATAMARFRAYAAAHSGRPIHDWPSLSQWSREHWREFWPRLLEFCDPIREGSAEPVCVGDAVESARFFPALKLNYAENLLRERPGESADRVVLTALDERGRRTDHTRTRLRREVLGLAQGLEALGIGPQSRVCALANNDAAAVIASLAAVSLGASWSSVSPGFGFDSVLARFGPLEPELLFAPTRMPYQGRSAPTADQITALIESIPSLRALVLLDDGELPFTPPLPVLRLSQLIAGPARAGYTRVPFDHPLVVLFSSGTTGAPKCIVHGHGGTLLEHLKELLLHSDLRASDKLCFVTGTGWMMWNWLVSALATDATVLLYDGSVSFPEPDSLLKRLAAEQVTLFGTSPAYLRYLQDSEIVPREVAPWPTLRGMFSTGSILYEDQFDFVERAFGPLPLQSISGGSDILGCFVLGNPLLPVWRGESQCISLGMDVRARDGEADLAEGTGELVCVNPFPSRPVGLHGDADGARFHAAYFAQNEGVWTHGDLIELTARGSARILGRSDGVLNIRGIRIGPAEIYGIVGRLPEIAEAMAVDQSAPELPGGRKLVLLVVLKPEVALDRPLGFRIKRELKDKAGQSHVPDLILAVTELPQTHNGKRSERAVQDLLNGRRPRNLGAIRNVEALRALLGHAELRLDPALLD